MIRAALAHADFVQLCGVIGLLFFVGVFALVAIRTFARRQAHYQQIAGLPLTEEIPCPPKIP